MIQPQWTASDAKRVLAAAARSGMSLDAYGRAQNLNPARLYWWRKRLRAMKDESTAGNRKTALALVPVTRPVTFVDLATEPDARSALIEVVLGNGRVVRVPPAFDDAVLARVLSVADGAA